jgi:pyruvate/2-oxoglutarate/acetoin dehydrogenase E1 component
MREINYTTAIREAQTLEMERDSSVFVVGEDVAEFGSAFGQTAGLLEKFGPMRCVNTPISEACIIGMSVGAAATGLRPIAVIDFMDFMGCCMDEVLNQAAKLRFMMGGQVTIPLVIRAQGGAGINAAAQHSQSLEALFTHIPGLKIVAASTPADVKGLITSAVRDDNPVMVIEHKTLLNMKGEVPEGEHLVPIGKAAVRREGSDVTIVAWSAMVHRSLKAAEMLSKEGIEAEVIDIRSLIPLDKETIFKSLEKTGRIVVVYESVITNGYGSEIVSIIAEECMDWLDAPIKRVAAPHTHCPFSPVLEELYVPSVDRIVKSVKELF